jgi:hypothetical protein
MTIGFIIVAFVIGYFLAKKYSVKIIPNETPNKSENKSDKK